MMLHVTFPHEPFNAAVKDGSVGAKMKRILEQLKPEATYFTDHRGHRSAIVIVDVADASRIPAFAEPWFLMFNADIEFHAVMGPQDLAAAGLEGLGKAWS
jgi:hypothetical protein